MDRAVDAPGGRVRGVVALHDIRILRMQTQRCNRFADRVNKDVRDNAIVGFSQRLKPFSDRRPAGYVAP